MYNQKEKVKEARFIYNKLLKRSKQLHHQIGKTKEKLKEFPEGKLICCGNDFYLSDGHKKTYIKKHDRILVEKLAEKKYFSSLLEDLKKEKIATDMYLRHFPKNKKLDDFFASPKAFQNLLSPQFFPLSAKLDNWMKSPYTKNLKHPEHLTQKVGPNEFVRSKSEAMIAKLLKQNNIPYRYECQLCLNDVELYPDFTIRHPRTGEFFYWEHFGWLDKPDYVKSMHLKLQLFTENKILPGINLITTYENGENPLSFEYVEMLIHYYFL